MIGVWCFGDVCLSFGVMLVYHRIGGRTMVGITGIQLAKDYSQDEKCLGR